MLRVQQKLIKHAQQHRAAGCIDITGPKIAGVESGAGEVSHEREACQVGWRKTVAREEKRLDMSITGALRKIRESSREEISRHRGKQNFQVQKDNFSFEQAVNDLICPRLGTRSPSFVAGFEKRNI